MQVRNRRVIGICFGLYTALMVYLLFLQRLGQGWFLFDSTWEQYTDYVRYCTNWVPFQTVGEMLNLAGKGAFLGFAVVNIGGNIGMFMPLGLFLPQLFVKQRRFGRFILTVAAAICLVEVMQVLTMLGSCDVDDLILNVLGASLGFLLWRLLPWGRAARRAVGK